MSAEVASLVGLALYAWSFVVTSVSIEATRRAMRTWSRQTRTQPSLPLTQEPVLMVRPCAGDEPSLERALTSLAHARRSFPLRCRFAIEGPNDKALPAAERAVLSLARAGIEAEIVFTGGGGPNRKAAQLARACEAERADTIVCCDSDVDLAGVDLDALLAPLFGPEGAWVAWAPPIERGEPSTLGDEASRALLGASLHAFPLLAELDPAGLVGKLFAIKTSALSAIGGFGSLSAYLGEDMEIARRILAKGGKIARASVLARSLASGRSWEAVVARFARWLTVIRAQRPLLLLSYPALFFATFPLFVLCLLALPLAKTAALFAALLALISRIGVASVAASIAGKPVRLGSALRDALLADLVLASAFVRALRSREVTWRDRVLVVDRAGLLREPGALGS